MSSSTTKQKNNIAIWLEDLPVPAAMMTLQGEFVWRNPMWIDLDPIEASPFIWPLEFFAQLKQCVDQIRTTTFRGLKHREHQQLFDVWAGGIAGQPELVWVIAVDVSVYQEDAFDQLHRQRVKDMATMLQGLLHEMRNPLAGIKGNVQLLKRKLPASAPHEYLQQILSDVERIDGLFQELTDLAAPLRLRLERSNLHILIDEALKTLTGLFQARHIRIKKRFDPSLPELEVDPDRLYRVYLNLLKNAFEASPDGSEIEIQTKIDHNWRAGQMGWTTMIHDQGHGVKEDVQALLFTPFFTTKRAGSGLGLAISLQIIQAHGGSLELHNHEGKNGAIASVTLPLKIRDEKQ